MDTKYYKDDDILVIRLSENKIVKERSLDWHTHVSFDENGFPVEIVLVEAHKKHRALFDACQGALINTIPNPAPA